MNMFLFLVGYLDIFANYDSAVKTSLTILTAWSLRKD